jgi:LPPG:FO 2-phospho-L-lactate transferase
VLNDMGFGIIGEKHELMDARRAAGEAVWFELGDDDLAVCAIRAEALAAGETLTSAHAKATSNYQSGGANVLPMSNEPVRTVIDTPEGPRGIQEFLIKDRSEPAVEGVRFIGIDVATITPQVADALSAADLIIVGPSNPAISIDPILAVGGMRDAIANASAPVLGVSPFVSGAVLKGPTAKFLEAAGVSADSSGAAAFYGDIIDAWVADEPVAGFPHHLADVAMSDPASTRAVAAEILRYGASLS